VIKGKMTKMKYCGNCKQWITTTKGPSIAITILLLILGIVPGIIYIIWAASKGGKCPMCNSTNWSIPPQEEEKKE
jgi:hypothetical protein